MSECKAFRQATKAEWKAARDVVARLIYWQNVIAALPDGDPKRARLPFLFLYQKVAHHWLCHFEALGKPRFGALLIYDFFQRYERIVLCECAKGPAPNISHWNQFHRLSQHPALHRTRIGRAILLGAEARAHAKWDFGLVLCNIERRLQCSVADKSHRIGRILFGRCAMLTFHKATTQTQSTVIGRLSLALCGPILVCVLWRWRRSGYRWAKARGDGFSSQVLQGNG